MSIITGSIVISPITLAMLSMFGQNNNGSFNIIKPILNALKNPIVIAPVLGTLFTLFGLSLPDYAVSSLNLIGVTVGGVALFVTGLLVSAQSIKLSTNIVVSCLLKNILHPLLAYAMMLPFAIPKEVVHAVLLLAAIPSGFFGVLFGLDAKVDMRLSGPTLLWSTITSIPTLAFVIYLLPKL